MKKLPAPVKPNLRQKAEDLLKKNTQKPVAHLSEAEVQKLVHELQTHQIELEMQNEELMLARDRAEAETKKFSRLYDLSPTAHFTLSKTGEIIAFNIQASQLIGKDRHHLKNSMIGFFISDDTKPVFNQFLDKVFTSKKYEACELTLLHINQRPIFVYVTGNCDENEETCFVSMVDVTIRRSQELLTQARLGLLQMAETSSLDDFLEETLNQAEKLTGSTIGFCHFVEADQITLRLQNWSTRTKKDYCRAEGKGMHYGLDKAGVWADCVREARPLIHNNYLTLPDKKGMPVGHARLTRELTVPVLRNGKIKAIIGVGNKPSDYTEHDLGLVAQLADLAWDITELKQKKQELLESEEKYRTVFATESDSLLLIDQETSAILDVNDAVCRLYGYTKDELLSMLNTDLSDEKEETKRKTKAFQEKIKLRYHKKKNGLVFPVEISASLFMLKNRPVILAAIRDISQRVLADSELAFKNYELQKINSEKDKFFSIISHDLRGPFNSFLGLTQIMSEKLPSLTMEEIQQIANSMRTSATNLYRLLENLLQWSRMKQGLIPFLPNRVNLRDAVGESLRMILDPAASKGIEIEYKIPDDLMVLADSNMLLAILRNLVSNAIKFTGKGGRISISAKAGANNNVEISIKDTGIGMDKHLIENLFVLDVSTSRKGTDGESSTGLGLIICKDFIEKQGGILKVESETGKGSIFRFTIPQQLKSKGKADNINIFEAPAGENQMKSLKILIAEDDETSEMLVSIAIRLFGREVIKVKNGIEAVNACRNHPDIDLIIMDIKMPEMDGYEATRQIRKFNKDVVIISQTAYGQPGDRDEAIAAGCNDYISKPLDLALFKEMIKKQFKK